MTPVPLIYERQERKVQWPKAVRGNSQGITEGQSPCWIGFCFCFYYGVSVPSHIASDVPLLSAPSPLLEQLRITYLGNITKLSEFCPNAGLWLSHCLLHFAITWVIIWLSNHHITRTQVSSRYLPGSESICPLWCSDSFWAFVYWPPSLRLDLSRCATALLASHGLLSCISP